MAKKIAVVTQDVGGSNVVVPVANKLREASVDIVPICLPNAKGDRFATKSFEKAGFTKCEAPSQPECPEKIDGLVISLCSKGQSNLGPRFVEKHLGEIPTFGIQDAPWSGAADHWQNYHPDHMLCFDSISAAAIRSLWPVVTTQTCASPAFDSLSCLNTEALRRQTRNMLRIRSTDTVIAFIGQISGTDYAYTELLNQLKKVDARTYHIINRCHPRMPAEAPEVFLSLNRIEQSCASFNYKFYPYTSPTLTTRDIICCSDLVVSMYSTVLFEACTLGIPTLSILYGTYPKMAFAADCANMFTQFPSVTNKCTFGPADTGELLSDLWKFTESEDLAEWQSACARHYPIDGKNAERCANYILDNL